MFNKIDAWNLPANAIQVVKLFNFVRTFVTCNLGVSLISVKKRQEVSRSVKNMFLLIISNIYY